MNKIIVEWLPTIVEIVTLLGTLIGVCKKFGKLDDIIETKKEIKVLRNQNRELKQKVENVEKISMTILRRQKGIKDDDIDSSKQK